MVAILAGPLAGVPALAVPIPHCKAPLGSVIVLEPDVDWWTDLGLASPRALLDAFVEDSGCFTRRTAAADLADKADFALMPDGLQIVPDRDLGPPRGGPATDGVGGGGVEPGGEGAPTVSGKRVAPREISAVELTLTDQRTRRPALRTRGSTRASAGGDAPILSAALGSAGAEAYVRTPIGRRFARGFLDAYCGLVSTLERQALKETRPKD
jgi:hypothetical protein